MAKRMQFSVVGLPHYTIWHLYEPSVEDMKHMEGMEQERRTKELNEKAEKERLRKIQEQFDSPREQWDRDMGMIKEAAKGGEGGGVGAGEDPVAAQREQKQPKGPTRLQKEGQDERLGR